MTAAVEMAEAATIIAVPTIITETAGQEKAAAVTTTVAAAVKATAAMPLQRTATAVADAAERQILLPAHPITEFPVIRKCPPTAPNPAAVMNHRVETTNTTLRKTPYVNKTADFVRQSYFIRCPGL